MEKQSDSVEYNHLQITKKIRSMGRDISPATMAAMELFMPFHERPPYKGVRFDQDIAYGPDSRNRMDIYVADCLRPDYKRDFLVFLHGGGSCPGFGCLSREEWSTKDLAGVLGAAYILVRDLVARDHTLSFKPHRFRLAAGG